MLAACSSDAAPQSAAPPSATIVVTPDDAPTPVPTKVDPTAAPTVEREGTTVQDLVEFVEQTRGEQFPEPPDVTFVDSLTLTAEFSSQMLGSGAFSPEVQRIVDRIDDVYRAFGLSGDDFSYLDAESSVLGEIDAFYDPQTDSIMFPSADGQPVDEIELRDRPLMVHELGHALQAHSRFSWSASLEDPSVAASILEGESEWLLDRYLDQLSNDEYFAWRQATSTDRLEPEVPAVLSAEFLSPYILGSRFFHVRYAINGLEGINDVFDSHRVVGRMILDPWAFDGTEVFAETFGFVPPLQTGSGEPINIAAEFPMSAVNWYFVLSTAMPAQQSLSAARGITSFTFPTGWIGIDDRLCFVVLVTAQDDHREVVERAFTEWADVQGVKRWSRPRDDYIEVGGCDPGVGNVPPARADALRALEVVSVVIDSELWAYRQGLDADVGFCVGWEFLAAITTEPTLDTFAWFNELEPSTLSSDC